MLEGVIDETAIKVFNGTDIDFHDFALIAEISLFILINMSDQITF